MSFIITSMRMLTNDRRGVTAMEYGLIAAATAVAISAALLLIGPKMTSIFGAINTAL